MLSFPVILINSISILMICAVIVVIWKRRSEACATQLIIVSIFMLIWATGSFLEMAAGGLTQKVFWRNITQIGAFGTPASILIFSIIYTAYFKKYVRKISIVVYSIQAAAVLFIFTDRWHHLARAGIFIANGSRYETLIIQTTPISRIFISINFVYMAVSLSALIVLLFSSNAKKMKKQALCMIAGMSISVVYSLLKVSSNEMFGEIFPVSGIFALADLCMLFGMFRYNLLILVTLARNEVFNIIGDGIITATEKGKIVDFNRAAEKIFNACTDGSTAPADNQRMESRISVVFPDWYDMLARNQTGQFHFTVENEGLPYHYICELYPVYSKQFPIGSISVIKDITEQKRNMELLKLRAERDGLTDAYNRKTFIELVDEVLRQSDSDVCLMFMDIDYFKNINDQYGHIFGDQVLKEICDLIQLQLKDGAVLCRMGGEEFAIFHPVNSGSCCQSFTENLRRMIAGHEFIYNAMPVQITVSIGVAIGRFDSFDTLYRTADENLYRAKETGRNRVFGCQNACVGDGTSVE